MSTENRKVRTGRVISNRMTKTVVVAVEGRTTHRLYHKGVRRVTKLYAHDEGRQCQVGDVVKIVETRPLSKTKRWRVAEILTRGELPAVAPEEIGLQEQEPETPQEAEPRQAIEAAQGPKEER